MEFLWQIVMVPRMADSNLPYIDLKHIEEIEAIMTEDAGPAVIDFWSPSCGPCMAMAGDFSQVAEQFDEDELSFFKVNTMANGDLAAPFNIRSVPTILFIHRGKILDAIIGSMPAAKLGARAEWLLKKSQRKGLFGRFRK